MEEEIQNKSISSLITIFHTIAYPYAHYIHLMMVVPTIRFSYL